MQVLHKPCLFFNWRYTGVTPNLYQRKIEGKKNISGYLYKYRSKSTEDVVSKIGNIRRKKSSLNYFLWRYRCKHTEDVVPKIGNVRRKKTVLTIFSEDIAVNIQKMPFQERKNGGDDIVFFSARQDCPGKNFVIDEREKRKKKIQGNMF